MTVYSHNNYETYYRRYIKVPEILASVGGLIKIIITIIAFANLPFSRINKYQTIINEIFHIPQDSTKKPSQTSQNMQLELTTNFAKVDVSQIKLHNNKYFLIDYGLVFSTIHKTFKTIKLIFIIIKIHF